MRCDSAVHSLSPEKIYAAVEWYFKSIEKEQWAQNPLFIREALKIMFSFRYCSAKLKL